MVDPISTPWPQARPARIAVLCGYMTYYEPHMPAGFRDQRVAWGQKITEIVATEGEARFFGLMTDAGVGEEVARALMQWRLDVLLLAPAMPGPPAFTWRAIASLPRVPAVVWSAGHLDTLPQSYDSVDHLANSGGVGVAMIGNLLARDGRGMRVVAGRWYDEQAQHRVREAVRLAAVAGRMASARVAVLGAPLDGYSNVVIAPELLSSALGATLVDIPLDEWEHAFAQTSQEDAEAVATVLRTRIAVDDAEGEDFRRSSKLAAALRTICDRYDADCGTFNSHLEFGHANEKIGLVGGMATSWMTSNGTPFTDTGDTVSALAMLLARLLAGNAIYTELNTIDYGRDAILCANTGEIDFAATVEGRSWVFPAAAYTGRRQRGCIVDAEVRTGPATIIGFSPNGRARSGVKLIAFAGTVTGRPELALRVPHTLFRPATTDAATAFAGWIEAGATHHAALCVGGDYRAEVAEIGRLLGIDVETIA